MREVIVFVVLAILSYILHLTCFKLSKDIEDVEKVTQGKITRIIENETGRTMYYVSFLNDAGAQMEGQSIHYFKTYNKYHIGDFVDIQYSINKYGHAQVVLLDAELIPCSNSLVTASKNLFIVSIIFMLIAVVFVVKLVL